MAVTVYFGVDWDKDGNYTDESARLLINTLVIRRGRETIMDTGGFTSMSPAEVWGELRNYDNRYDPFNSSSPIYGYILPSRPCKITVTSGATTYYVFTGWISDIRAMGVKEKNVIFRATDGLTYLNMQQCESRAAADETVAVGMDVLVSQSDWPVDFGSNIEDNGDMLTDWQPDPTQTIYEEMQEIAEAFSGTIFINAEGGFEYRVRDSNASTVLTITEDQIQREFETRNPWDEIYNDIRVDSRGYDNTSINSTSITNYGRRTAYVGGGTNDYVSSAYIAASLSDHILAYGAEIKRPLRVKFTNQFAYQFRLDLMDRVTVTLTDYGINNLYVVGYIEHRFLTRGNCITTMHLEPYYYETVSNTYPLTFPFTLGW